MLVADQCISRRTNCPLQNLRLLCTWLRISMLAIILAITPIVTRAQAFTVLRAFSGGADGGRPRGGLILVGTDIFGVVSTGGPYGEGGIFRLDTTTSPGTVYPLHYFLPSLDGYAPNGLQRDINGNLWGACQMGGSYGSGTIFELSSLGTQLYFAPAWQVRWAFQGGKAGAYPGSNLTFGPGPGGYAYAYGTAQGGANGQGLVYSYPISDTFLAPTCQPVYAFDAQHPGRTDSPVTIDASGNIYGETVRGPYPDGGDIYNLNGGFHTIYDFQETVNARYNDAMGWNPIHGLIEDGNGNLYGVTIDSPIFFGPGFLGHVFMIDPSGRETVLHRFSGPDGAFPSSPLTMDASGTLYGSCGGGGAHGKGVIYRIDASGNFAVIHDFEGGAAGEGPGDPLTLDGTNNLIGVAGTDAASRTEGLIYKLQIPPPAAQNVSSLVAITRSGFRKDRTTGRFIQTITIKNSIPSTINGPVSLVLDSLSSNASLYNKTGLTSATTPTGSPYIDVTSGSLAPGASASITLEFTDPSQAAITYSTRVLAGAGSR